MRQHFRLIYYLLLYVYCYCVITFADNVCCTIIFIYLVYGQDYSPMLTRTSSGKEFLLVFMENYVEGSRKPDYPMLKGTNYICVASALVGVNTLVKMYSYVFLDLVEDVLFKRVIFLFLGSFNYYLSQLPPSV